MNIFNFVLKTLKHQKKKRKEKRIQQGKGEERQKNCGSLFIFYKKKLYIIVTKIIY